MSTLAQLREHVAAWGGLNAEDATTLLELLEATDCRIEYAIQTYDEPMRPDLPARRMTFVDREDASHARVIGPWGPS